MIEGAHVLALALLLAAAPLEDAAAALVAGDPACGRLAQLALTSGTLDVPGVAHAWMLRGQCFVLAGDVDRAERSYAVALRLDPRVAADDDAFAAAKRTLPPIAALAARAAAVNDDTVEVELLGDDLLLVKGALLTRGADEVARVPLEAGHAKHKVSGIGRHGLLATLVDKHGNALLRLPVEATVQHVLTPAPASAGVAPTILTTLGATAIGAGIVGVIASGIGLAALGPSALKDGQVWVVGVGASTGLFLVGAGMVVLDQGL